MILITDVKYIKTVEDVYIHVDYGNISTSGYSDYPFRYMTSIAQQERIIGTELIKANGDRVCVGMTKKVKRDIGFLLDRFASLDLNTMDFLRLEISRLKDTIANLKLDNKQAIEALNNYKSMFLKSGK